MQRSSGILSFRTAHHAMLCRIVFLTASTLRPMAQSVAIFWNTLSSSRTWYCVGQAVPSYPRHTWRKIIDVSLLCFCLVPWCQARPSIVRLVVCTLVVWLKQAIPMDMCLRFFVTSSSTSCPHSKSGGSCPSRAIPPMQFLELLFPFLLCFTFCPQVFCCSENSKRFWL